jgi:hypothetical protein
MWVPMIAGIGRMYGIGDATSEGGAVGTDAGVVAGSIVAALTQNPASSGYYGPDINPATGQYTGPALPPSTAAAPALPSVPSVPSTPAGDSVSTAIAKSGIPPWLLGVGGAVAVWMLIRGLGKKR